MMFGAVTTFNAVGFDLYGRKMIYSFHQFWPDTVRLTVYSERWSQEGTIDLHSISPWLVNFKTRHGLRKYRDFRWDAVKFAHKIAAVCHAARSTSADVLIWMDGDIVTHSPITLDDLEELAPKGDEWIAWLDRDNNYPECGLYLLNCRHPRHLEMIDALQGMYEDDKLFGLPEWHDSFVLAHVVKTTGIGTKSLSGNCRNTSHPLVSGPLGKWMDHLKGNRKQEGRSRKGDFKVQREEEYWR